MLWNLHSMAKEYSRLPSDIMHISDPYLAYCVDNAVFSVGMEIDGELAAVKGKTDKAIQRGRERVMQKWLGIKQKFRNPTMPTTTREQLDKIAEGAD